MERSLFEIENERKMVDFYCKLLKVSIKRVKERERNGLKEEAEELRSNVEKEEILSDEIDELIAKAELVFSSKESKFISKKTKKDGLSKSNATNHRATGPLKKNEKSEDSTKLNACAKSAKPLAPTSKNVEKRIDCKPKSLTTRTNSKVVSNKNLTSGGRVKTIDSEIKTKLDSKLPSENEKNNSSSALENNKNDETRLFESNFKEFYCRCKRLSRKIEKHLTKSPGDRMRAVNGFMTSLQCDWSSESNNDLIVEEYLREFLSEVKINGKIAETDEVVSRLASDFEADKYPIQSVVCQQKEAFAGLFAEQVIPKLADQIQQSDKTAHTYCQMNWLLNGTYPTLLCVKEND